MLGRFLSEVFGGKPSPGNPLWEYFRNNPGRPIDKWHHYFDIYHRHFGAFRGRSPVVVEIGIFKGGSLEMWREYFGPGAHIVGVDIEPRCGAFADEAITVLQGDQADRAFLAELRRRFPRVDIVIDDGGHTMEQQITTLEELYPHVQPHGVYLCEDVHTSFMPDYGGGHRRSGTFLEHAKTMVDRLHGWHCAEVGVGDFTRSTNAVHFYDSVVVFEKRPREQPRQSVTGKAR